MEETFEFAPEEKAALRDALGVAVGRIRDGKATSLGIPMPQDWIDDDGKVKREVYDFMSETTREAALEKGLPEATIDRLLAAVTKAMLAAEEQRLPEHILGELDEALEGAHQALSVFGRPLTHIARGSDSGRQVYELGQLTAMIGSALGLIGSARDQLAHYRTCACLNDASDEAKDAATESPETQIQGQAP